MLMTYKKKHSDTQVFTESRTLVGRMALSAEVVQCRYTEGRPVEFECLESSCKTRNLLETYKRTQMQPRSFILQAEFTRESQAKKQKKKQKKTPLQEAMNTGLM